MVGCQNPTYWDGATICSCSRSILFLTSDKCDLHLQEHPIVDKLLHLGYVQSFGHGKMISQESVMESLELFLFASFLQLVSLSLGFCPYL